MSLSTLLVALLLILPFHQKQRVDWCKIVPFQTTREEIEAMLGRPVETSGYILTYDTPDDHRITVWYGGVKARTGSNCRWVLPENTVLSFVYAPKKQVPLTEVNVDLTKFKKEKAIEMVNDFHYYNPDEGLTLTSRLVNGQEMFLSLERDPNQALRDKYCRH